MVRFALNGCDVNLLARASENLTVEELVDACDKIKPLYCTCGICKPENAHICEYKDTDEPDVEIVKQDDGTVKIVALSNNVYVRD